MATLRKSEQRALLDWMRDTATSIRYIQLSVTPGLTGAEALRVNQRLTNLAKALDDEAFRVQIKLDDLAG
ncbi:MAG: hypothetical protein GXY76_14315 [Chloroflexi bacterium]|nr:hypothetical protein [Chloroflexota bacterium]